MQRSRLPRVPNRRHGAEGGRENVRHQRRRALRVRERRQPLTDGESGLRVVRVLNALQTSLHGPVAQGVQID